MKIRTNMVVGLLAGVVAALLHLSVASATPVGLLLFYLAPLPGHMAGLGWGERAAIITAMSGTLLVALALGILAAMIFLLAQALPAVIISHFAFLYRIVSPAGSGGGEDGGVERGMADDMARDRAVAADGIDGTDGGLPAEWYPPGRMVLMILAYGWLLSLLAIIMLGPSHQDYLHNTGQAFDQLSGTISRSGFGERVQGAQLARIKEMMQAMLPAIMVVMWSITTLLNIWLAARIVRMSGLLRRPWSPLSHIEYPPLFALLLPAVLLIAGLAHGGGMIGLAITALAATLLLAFLLLGLAVVHELTRPLQAARIPLIAISYMTTLFMGWGAMLLVGLGLVDSLFGLRRRNWQQERGADG